MSSILNTTTASKSHEGSVHGCFPQIETMQDVITNFFNQIVEYVITDMIVVDLEEKPPVEIAFDETVKEYKELEPEDLLNSQVHSASGSKVTLTKRSSSRMEKNESRKNNIASNLEVIREASENQSKASTETSLQDLRTEDRRKVKIYFTNGCVYEGFVANRIMNGEGRYTWTDGAVYEGNFKDGFPDGKGWMTLPDLSHYEGDFNGGLFHGRGFYNIVSTPAFYNGEWKNGEKHGEGWFLYEAGDWYEGSWANDLKDGFGLRHYKNGSKYRGMWGRGQYHGEGIMIWENNDGEWKKGVMHGEGDYIWNAFFNNVFAFPIQNTYTGSWRCGKRSGKGIMHFGDSTGLKLKGTWDQDFKHGPGYLVCGNGKILESPSLFHYDKLVQTEKFGDFHVSSRSLHRLIDVTIFSSPEYVSVGHYVEQILAQLEGVSPEKLKVVKSFEKKCIRNIIIQYLPQLKQLYQDYAVIAAETTLAYEPVMIRLFLWQFYKDKAIWKRGISLTDVDEILASNPKSCLETHHNPFEPIYFWQFLMSLIGVALTTCSLEDIDDTSQQGVSASIVLNFLKEITFVKTADPRNSLLLTYLHLAPIKAVYSFYQLMGEPLTACSFLKKTCVRKNGNLCYSKLFFKGGKPSCGFNLVPIDKYVAFVKTTPSRSSTGIDIRCYTSLADFNHLGPKNIVRCLATACTLMVEENLVVNIDYKLTFFEFYETLLICIFLALEIEVKEEQKRLVEAMMMSNTPPKKGRKSSSDSKGRSSRDSKRSKRNSKKSN